MKIEDLKKGERYYYARLKEYPIAFSFVLLGKTKYYSSNGNFYKLFYKSPYRPNLTCELDIIEDSANIHRKFNESDIATLKLTDSIFISNNKGSLAREIKKYYRAKSSILLFIKKYYKVINELKEA